MTLCWMGWFDAINICEGKTIDSKHKFIHWVLADKKEKHQIMNRFDVRSIKFMKNLNDHWINSFSLNIS